MELRIGNRSDAVALLKAILDIERKSIAFSPISYRIEDCECTLVECLEALLDALEREIV